MDERGVLYTLSKDETLNTNIFLNVWLRKYKELNIGELKSFFEKLDTYYQDNSVLAGEMNQDTIDQCEYDTIVQDLDYRIKRVELSGFRGIRNNAPPYGLDFCYASEPSNAVIFGNNGTGKSSIYQAIEFLFTEKIGEADLREYKLQDKQRYDLYSNNDNTENNSDKMCRVEAVDATKTYSNGAYTDEGLQRIVKYDLCFFSENDIYNLGKTIWDGKGKGKGKEKDINTIQNTFAKKLGLEAWVNVLASLTQIIEYKPKRKKPVNGEVDERHKFLKEEITILTDRLTKISQTNTSNSQQEVPIKTIIEKFQAIDDNNIRMVDEILKDLTIVELNIDVLESYEVGYNENMIRFLALGLELIVDNPSCPFCEQDNKTTSTIETEVKRRLQKLKEENNKIDAVYKTANRAINMIRGYNNYIADIQTSISNDLSAAADYIELSEYRDLCSKMLSFIDLIHNIFINQKTSDASTLSIKEIYDLSRAIRYELTRIYPSTFSELSKLIQDRNATLAKLATPQPENGKNNEDEDENVIKARIKLYQNELDQKEQELTEATRFFGTMDKVKKDSEDIKKIVDGRIIKWLSNLLEPLQITIENVMNDYLKDDDLEINIQKPVFNEDENIRRDLSIMLKRKAGGQLIDPARHFNTYRYKLFCFAVNMGLLLAYRKQYKINLPIIIDDAFYSSDYVNLVLFQDTIKKIIYLFSKHTPNMTMQMILFTHDLCIFKSVSNALSYQQKDLLLYKLFSVNQGENKGNYVSLGYKLPKPNVLKENEQANRG
ncbi:MAG: hypothetical protein PHO32_07660 [Candidatus Cloacimonetes bacterium]|nr:hypothetical protein [Candidatus Cloacimonadota bacterium]